MGTVVVTQQFFWQLEKQNLTSALAGYMHFVCYWPYAGNYYSTAVHTNSYNLWNKQQLTSQWIRNMMVHIPRESPRNTTAEDICTLRSAISTSWPPSTKPHLSTCVNLNTLWQNKRQMLQKREEDNDCEINTWWSSSSLINSMASSIPNLSLNIARGITREWAAAAIASMDASSQSVVFFKTVSTALVRPSSCLPPKKVVYTTGLNPNSVFTQSSMGSIFSFCFSTNRN